MNIPSASPAIKFPLPSYTHGEDVVLAWLLGFKRGGIYVDVGCYHPIDFSNTYLLSKELGWLGICIDADDTYLPYYQQVRPRDAVVNCGIGQTEGQLDFYEFPHDRSVNTFDLNVANHYRAQGHEPTIRQVPVRKLSTILAEANLPAVHFLNIDVEGNDLDVLKSNDWSRWRPSIIAIEDWHANLHNPSASPVFQYLTALDYKFFAKLHMTSFYTDNKTVRDAVLPNLPQTQG